MDIIDAKLEDEKEFIDMETTFSKTSACSQEISKEMAKKNFDAAINGAYSRILMFKEDDKTIGYGYLSKSHSTEKGGISIWLEELYVKENYRGGVGKKFLSFLNDEYNHGADVSRLYRRRVPSQHFSGRLKSPTEMLRSLRSTAPVAIVAA